MRIGNGGAFIRTLPGGQKVKRCAGCKVDHDVSAFSQGTGPGGLHRHCREYQRRWRQQRNAGQKATRSPYDLAGSAEYPGE